MKTFRRSLTTLILSEQEKIWAPEVYALTRKQKCWCSNLEPSRKSKMPRASRNQFDNPFKIPIVMVSNVKFKYVYNSAEFWAFSYIWYVATFSSIQLIITEVKIIVEVFYRATNWRHFKMLELWKSFYLLRFFNWHKNKQSKPSSPRGKYLHEISWLLER